MDDRFNRREAMKKTATAFFKNAREKMKIVLIPVMALGLSMGIGLSKEFEGGNTIPTSIYEVKQTYPDLVYYKGTSSSNGSELSLSAQSAILVESSTGTILYAKNEHQRRDPASITKVMTAIVALERGDLSSVVEVSDKAAKVSGSSVGLRAGEQHKLEELLRSTIVKSGNDGATAIAEHVGGDVDGFVKLMNARGKTMGLKNTNFMNPHGLTQDGHFSTAYDLAVMCITGLSNEKFADMVSTKEQWYSMLEDGESDWFQNTNKLLWSFAGADGVKTGTTDRAGNCLASSATRDGLQFIAVVLNSPSRWNDSAKLLEYGFSEFTRVDIVDRGESVGSVDIKVSDQETEKVDMITGSDFRLVVAKKDLEKLKVEVAVDTDLRAPVGLGDKVGEVGAFIDSEKVGSRALYPVSSVEKKGLLYRLKNTFRGE